MHFLGRGHSLNARIFNKKQPFLCKHKGLFFIAYSALISLLSRRLLDDCSNTSRSYCTATLTALESCFLWCSPCFLWLKSVFFRQFGSWYFYLPEFLAPFWHRKGADYTYKLEFVYHFVYGSVSLPSYTNTFISVFVSTAA